MKTLFLLFALLPINSYAKVYILAGEDLLNFTQEDHKIETTEEREYFTHYDDYCKSSNRRVYTVKLKLEEEITLFISCLGSSGFIENYLFETIDSPNLIQCKLETNCYIDYNGQEKCQHTYGSQIQTNFLYVSTDTNGVATSVQKRHKLTECK